MWLESWSFWLFGKENLWNLVKRKCFSFKKIHLNMWFAKCSVWIASIDNWDLHKGHEWTGYYMFVVVIGQKVRLGHVSSACCKIPTKLEKVKLIPFVMLTSMLFTYIQDYMTTLLAVHPPSHLKFNWKKKSLFIYRAHGLLQYIQYPSLIKSDLMKAYSAITSNTFA